MSDPTYLDDFNSLLITAEDKADEDEEYYTSAASAAAVLAMAEAGHQIGIENRHQTWLYLCRSQLLPNPRSNTPWQALFDSQNDRAFITTMGFDVEAFDYILASGFAAAWYETPIPQEDTSTGGNPRPWCRSLDAAGALGLVLHYLNSTMTEISLQQIFAIIPTTASRYITFGLSILFSTLQKMPEAQIHWPESVEFEELSALVTQRHPRLHGAFGSVDGLKLPVKTSDDLDIENATFNGWLSEHFVNSVVVFSSKGSRHDPFCVLLTVAHDTCQGMIIAANINAPGSWHDSRVAQPIYRTLRAKTPDGFYLIADTAFPRGTADIAGRICTPLKEGQQVVGTADQITKATAFNQELLSYRQTAEWGMRAIQGSFGRLRIPLDINNNAKRGNLIETCLRLHNLRAVKVGINQIRTVYLQHWQQTDEDVEVWMGFADMLFSDQVKKDRVSRFHVTLQYE